MGEKWLLCSRVCSYDFNVICLSKKYLSIIYLKGAYIDGKWLYGNHYINKTLCVP